jgi:hypothetical protein
MKSSRLGSIALAASIATLAACETPTGTTSAALSEGQCPAMPAVAGAGTDLTPAADQRLWFVLHGVGTQDYVCNAAGNGWTFVGPRADLLDAGGEVVGTHYASAAGPTRPAWQFEDGSIVIMRRAAGITVDPTAIPWLLLVADSHDGDGRFAKATTIQRLSTVGGIAPALPCTPGAAAAVPYETDYAFYRTGHGNADGNPACASTR